MYHVVGIQRREYTSKRTGALIRGYNVFCTFEDDNISGFGVLEVKMRNERLSVNPKTGQRFLVPPKIVPSFKPSNKLKDKFK